MTYPWSPATVATGVAWLGECNLDQSLTAKDCALLDRSFTRMLREQPDAAENALLQTFHLCPDALLTYCLAATRTAVKRKETSPVTESFVDRVLQAVTSRSKRAWRGQLEAAAVNVFSPRMRATWYLTALLNYLEFSQGTTQLDWLGMFDTAAFRARVFQQLQAFVVATRLATGRDRTFTVAYIKAHNLDVRGKSNAERAILVLQQCCPALVPQFEVMQGLDVEPALLYDLLYPPKFSQGITAPLPDLG